MEHHRNPKPGTVHQARNYAETRVTELGTALAKARADKDLLLRRVGVLAAELDRLIGADARIALMWREGVLP